MEKNSKSCYNTNALIAESNIYIPLICNNYSDTDENKYDCTVRIDHYSQKEEENRQKLIELMQKFDYYFNLEFNHQN